MLDWKCPLEEIPVGKGRRLKEGKDLAVITLGPIGNVAARAIERAEKDKGISIAHYDLRFLKPLDEALLHEVGLNFQHVVTIEDGVKKEEWAVPYWSSWRTMTIFPISDVSVYPMPS